MNRDSQESLEEKFPTLDSPVPLEEIFPLRKNANDYGYVSQELLEQWERWANIVEVKSK